jgi:hypothetical protein
MATAMQQQQPAAASPSLLLFDGVPVDSPSDYFTDSDDEEPPLLDESTTFKWDEFILRAPEESSGKQSLRRLRKAGGLVRMMNSITGAATSSETSVAELAEDFAASVGGLAAELAKRYGDAAVEHLAQLLAEVREFGLCDDLEEGVAFPPSHSDVGEELARRVADVVAVELEHFKEEKTWSADEASGGAAEKGGQVAALLRSLREYDDVQMEQVAFVTEQTARRAHIAKVGDMEQKLEGFRTVAMAHQGAEVQQLWADWQQKETDLLQRVSEAEAAASAAAQRASTARRMYESAEEQQQKKQAVTDQINKQLGTEATIVTQRNRMLQKERDSLAAEVKRLEAELLHNTKRSEILTAQREQALALRARGTGARGSAHDLKTDTGASQARAQAEAHLEELRAMKTRLGIATAGDSTDGGHGDAGGQEQTAGGGAGGGAGGAGSPSLLPSALTVSVDGDGHGRHHHHQLHHHHQQQQQQQQHTLVEEQQQEEVAVQKYRSFAEGMDDAYSNSRTPMRRTQSVDHHPKYGRRSPSSSAAASPSPSPSSSSPLALAARQQRRKKAAGGSSGGGGPKNLSLRAMRRHKSTPSPVGEMMRRSHDADGSKSPTCTIAKENMIISKDGKIAMERPSLRVAALNNDYAEEALAQLRASMAAAEEPSSSSSAPSNADGEHEHEERMAKVASAVHSQEEMMTKLRQTTSAVLPPTAADAAANADADAGGDGEGVLGGMLASAIGIGGGGGGGGGGSDHLIPPASRMTVSPAAGAGRRGSGGSSGSGGAGGGGSHGSGGSRRRVMSPMKPSGPPSSIGAGL